MSVGEVVKQGMIILKKCQLRPYTINKLEKELDISNSKLRTYINSLEKEGFLKLSRTGRSENGKRCAEYSSTISLEEFLNL